MSMKEPFLFAQNPDWAGKQLENWRLERKLGAGGMSIVYLARHLWLSQEAAVKVLRPEFCRDVNALHRFQQEALAASRLQHENVIEVKDFGRDPDVGYFMILEKLEGVDLDAFMAHTPLPKSWILGICRQICSALNTTHKANIIHRDLKPSNVFLVPQPNQPFPRVKLLDFGVAKVHFEETQQKLTTTGMIVGTPAFLAPEQVVPQGELAPSADIYAFGVMLFKLLTGKLPIYAENAIQHVIKVLQEAPMMVGEIRPELAGTELESLVNRLLAKTPDQRPQSMSEVWQELHIAAQSFEDPLDHESAYPNVQEAMLEEAKKEDEAQTPSVITARFSKQVDSFDNLPAAFPVIALPTGNIAFEETADFPAFRASKPQTKETSNQDTVITPPSTGRPVWMGVATGLTLLLVVVTGWWVTRAQSSGPAAPIVRKVTTDNKRSELDRLVIQGYKELKQGNFNKATRVWKKAMKRRGWSKSRHFPQLYKAAGIAYQKQNRLGSAVRYFDRYVVAVKSLQTRKQSLLLQQREAVRKGDAKKGKLLAGLLQKLINRMPSEQRMQKELHQIHTIHVKLKRQESTAQTLLAQLRKAAVQQKWQDAQRIFRQLHQFLPSHPSVQTKVATLVADKMPHLSVRLFREVLAQDESTGSEKKKLQAQLATVQAKLETRQREFRVWLKQLQDLVREKRFGKARRLLRSALKDPTKWLVHGFVHKGLQDWLQSLLQRNARQARSLWDLYARKQRELERSGLHSWTTSKKETVVSYKRLRQQSKAFRWFLRVQGGLRGAQQAAQKGQARRAIRMYKKSLQAWTSLKKELRATMEKRLSLTQAEVRSRHEKLTIAVRWTQKAQSAFRRAAFDKARGLQEKAVHSAVFSVLASRWKQQLERNSRQARMYTAIVNQGHRAFVRTQWKTARKQYQRFLKTFPRAQQASLLQRRIKTCNCGIGGVPWLDCSKEKVTIRRLSRKRR